MVQGCINKLSQIIVQSRVHPTGELRPQTTFRLDFPEVPSISEAVQAEIKRNPHAAILVDIYVSSPELESDALLERWSLQYESVSRARSAGGVNGRPVNKPEMFQRMLLLVRSVYSCTRFLPAARLFRIASTEAHRESRRPRFTLRHNIGTGSSSTAFASQPEAFGFPPIDTQEGRLRLSVLYRSDCGFAFAEAPALGGHIISDYATKVQGSTPAKVEAVPPAKAAPTKRTLPGALASAEPRALAPPTPSDAHRIESVHSSLSASSISDPAPAGPDVAATPPVRQAAQKRAVHVSRQVGFSPQPVMTPEPIVPEKVNGDGPAYQTPPPRQPAQLPIERLPWTDAARPLRPASTGSTSRQTPRRASDPALLPAGVRLVEVQRVTNDDGASGTALEHGVVITSSAVVAGGAATRASDGPRRRQRARSAGHPARATRSRLPPAGGSQPRPIAVEVLGMASSRPPLRPGSAQTAYGRIGTPPQRILIPGGRRGAGVNSPATPYGHTPPFAAATSSCDSSPTLVSILQPSFTPPFEYKAVSGSGGGVGAPLGLQHASRERTASWQGSDDEGNPIILNVDPFKSADPSTSTPSAPGSAPAARGGGILIRQNLHRARDSVGSVGGYSHTPPHIRRSPLHGTSFPLGPNLSPLKLASPQLMQHSPGTHVPPLALQRSGLAPSPGGSGGFPRAFAPAFAQDDDTELGAFMERLREAPARLPMFECRGKTVNELLREVARYEKTHTKVYSQMSKKRA